MRILCVIVSLLLVLTGCSAQELEQVSDVYAPVEQQEKTFVFDLPADADTQVLEGDGGKLYFCDGYEISVQTFASGDVSNTLRQISGRDGVTVYKTRHNGVDRYDCVWVSAAEGGDEVYRAVILDDGSYHYCLCACAAANESGSLQASWQKLFSSVNLAD